VSWFGRMGLHLAAALGATGIFVAAAAVGANQTRQNTEIVAAPTSVPGRPPAVRRERAITGTVRDVRGDVLIVAGPRGQEFRVIPDVGALIRLNGKAIKLEALQTNDQVAIIGQVQVRNGGFLAHAITARRK
jgi:hypothetical protein